MADISTEEKLITDALNGKQLAISELIRTYQSYVFNLCYKVLKNKEEAEEATQDCFVKAIRALRAFKKESSFKTWLYRIAYNTALNKLRSLKRYKVDEIDINLEETLQEKNVSNAGDYDLRVIKTTIQKAFNTLTPENRVIISLYYIEQFSIDEISSIVLLGQNVVKIRLHRSREQIKPLLNHLKSIKNS